jgi:hypothetical protein
LKGGSHFEWKGIRGLFREGGLQAALFI